MARVKEQGTAAPCPQAATSQERQFLSVKKQPLTWANRDGIFSNFAQPAPRWLLQAGTGVAALSDSFAIDQLLVWPVFFPVALENLEMAEREPFILLS